MSFINSGQQLCSYIDDNGCGSDTIYIRGVCSVSDEDTISVANKMPMTHLPMFNTVIIWDNVYKKDFKESKKSKSSGDNVNVYSKSSHSSSGSKRMRKRKGKAKGRKYPIVESGEEYFREDIGDGNYDSIGEGSGAGIGEGTEPTTIASFETGIEYSATCTCKNSKKQSSLESMAHKYMKKIKEKRAAKSVKASCLDEMSSESISMLVLKAMQDLGGFATSKRLIDFICKVTHAESNIVFQLVNSALDWAENMGYVRCIGKYFSLNYDKMFKERPELLNQLNRQEGAAALCPNEFDSKTKEKRKRGKRDNADDKIRPAWK